MTWNKREVIEGEVYGELTVICEAPTYVYPSGRKRRRLLCSCTCGSEPKEYMINAVVGGNTTSCGCVNLARITTHGMHKTRQYQTWADMKTRCDNVKHKWYPEYGGRGIGYQESWASFELFWEDMKETYQDHLTLDRIDNDKGYSKENCRWAEAKYQSHNQRKAKGSKNKYLGVRIDDFCDSIGARIKRDGKQCYLGTFATEEIAAKAYDDASEIIYGDRPNKTESCDDETLVRVKERLEGIANGISFKAVGSSFKNAVLDENKAVEIYLLAHEGLLTQKQIAAKFNINQGMISAIKRGSSWAHATKDLREKKFKIPLDDTLK